MANKDFLNFNYSDPLKDSGNLNEYLENKKEVTRFNLFSKTNSQSASSNKSWLIIFVLMLSLVGLGTYSLIKNRENENQIASLKTQNVAGANEDISKNIVTADNFSLILSKQAPTGFKLDRKIIQSNFLDKKDTVQTDYKIVNTKVGQDLISGIEVQITEYDNKLDKTGFEEKVLTVLGPDYEIKSTDISLPKDIKVSKIQEKTETQDSAYYVTVTEDNYYIIKVLNESARYEEFSQVSNFVDTLLSSLYLN